MSLSAKWKSLIVDVICLLFILLFVYAAVNKLLDFENFQVQIGQSPLLSAYASWISWVVVFIEILIAILLIFPQSRRVALWAAFNLMLMFTIYIFIILNYSSYVPCSCGGILEKMTWEIHLAFNSIFVVLAALAILLNQKNGRRLKFTEGVLMTASVFSSMLIVVALYIISERVMHYSNPFTRRYIKTSIQYVGSKDLKFNSYYFAGYSGANIYLGNSTAPLRIIGIDTACIIRGDFMIGFKDTNIPFKAVRINIQDKYFYFGDGTVPCLYRGKISEWKTDVEFSGVPRFSTMQPMDSSSFVLRNNTGKNGSNIIGTYSTGNKSEINYAPNLLQSQLDGIFDTDGTLLYNEQLKSIVYVYYYRNEFITADRNGRIVRIGNTIDTTSKAKIKVATLKEGKQRKMAAPPLVVNARICTQGKYLFVQSNIRGFYESDSIWNTAAVIDVYNLKDNTYVLSFPIFGLHNGAFKSFAVSGTHLYAIFDSTLMVFRLKGVIKEEMNDYAKQ